MQHSLLFISTLLTGLVAGLLFAYACSVNPGLGALPAPEYLRAMQSINRAIQNPFFLFVFMGAGLVLGFAVLRLGAGRIQPDAYRWLVFAALFYFFGVFGVTFLGNIPLNNRLDAFRLDAAGEPEISAVRTAFEGAWNRLHLARTFAATLAFAACIFSIFKS